jgi:hypothetical protein
VIRRPVLALGALLAALSLSSCATLSSNNDAASVGDATLSRDDFQAYLRDYLTVSSPGAPTDQIGGDDARGLLSSWVGDQLIMQYLDSVGVPITDADRQTASDDLDESLGDPQSISQTTHDLVVASGAARAVFSNTQDAGALGPFAQDIDVDVDSRYGYWDIESGSIVAFS